MAYSILLKCAVCIYLNCTTKRCSLESALNLGHICAERGEWNGMGPPPLLILAIHLDLIWVMNLESSNAQPTFNTCTQNAVNGLTMAIERGECFGLLGPNGAGKVRQ